MHTYLFYLMHVRIFLTTSWIPLELQLFSWGDCVLVPHCNRIFKLCPTKKKLFDNLLCMLKGATPIHVQAKFPVGSDFIHWRRNNALEFPFELHGCLLALVRNAWHIYILLLYIPTQLFVVGLTSMKLGSYRTNIVSA